MLATTVRVVPNVAGIAKEFDYSVPAALASSVAVGALVRIELNGRRVAGWITAIDPVVDDGVTLRPLLKVSSAGPSADVVDLARWAAHRWHGRLTSVLTSASPSTMVPVRPRSTSTSTTVPHPPAAPSELVTSAFASPGVTVVRLGPNDDAAPFLAAAAARGSAMALVPLVAEANHLASVLRRHGVDTHRLPRDWDASRSGGLAIGARSTVWASVPDLRSIVVVDEHDEGLQDERNPTWNARDVAIERARRLGIPCVLLSPAPSACALAAADRVLSADRRTERSSWPVIRVADRRREDPTRAGLFSPALIQLLRSPGRVVCVLNRKGRAQMLACGNCGELVKTADGEQLMTERDGQLVSPTTDERRPLFCAVCGGTTLKRIRLGIGRAGEELAALAGEPVGEVGRETLRPISGFSLVPKPSSTRSPRPRALRSSTLIKSFWRRVIARPNRPWPCSFVLLASLEPAAVRARSSCKPGPPIIEYSRRWCGPTLGVLAPTSSRFDDRLASPVWGNR
ncbi:MAG: hypothetical protein R2706_12735 [Acidimicrobiales bacterium]